MYKILVVGLTGGVGGVETFICNLDKYIDKSIFKVDYLVHQKIQDRYLIPLKENNSNIFCVKGIKEDFFGYIGSIFKFYLKNKDYNIIYLNECGAGFFLYALPCLFNRKSKLIVHSHNGDTPNRMLHNIFRILQNRRLNAQWACSEIAAQWMFGKKNIKKYGYKLIQNGIDLNKYKFNEEIRDKYREKFGLNNNFIIGSVARFENQKNHKFMIEVFFEMYKLDSRIKLILVGIGQELDNIRELVYKYKLESQVLFLGVRNDISNLLQMFDMFLLPSLYEGLPFVAIEAQAANLPILVSDSVSKEIDLTPLVFRQSLKNNAVEWVKTINNIKSNYPNRKDNRNIKLLQESGFDIENVVNDIQNEYINIINSSNRIKYY